jgi:hypothetical protein
VCFDKVEVTCSMPQCEHCVCVNCFRRLRFFGPEKHRKGLYLPIDLKNMIAAPEDFDTNFEREDEDFSDDYCANICVACIKEQTKGCDIQKLKDDVKSVKKLIRVLEALQPTNTLEECICGLEKICA